MKISKVIVPLAVTTAALGYLAANTKKSGKSSKVMSDIAKFTSDATVKASEKTFGGLKQSVIDKIVLNTPRGVKAVINGDILEFWYKSGSGKQTHTVKIELDSAGGLITFLSYFDAKSPRFFMENLRDAMNKVN